MIRRSLPTTDAGASRRFAERFRNRLAFVPGFGWHAYDDLRWALDQTGKVMRYAREISDAVAAEAMTCPSGTTARKRLLEFAVKLQSLARVRAMVAFAESEPEYVVPVDRFDRDPYLLNTVSGILDLRTSELRPHRPEALLMKLAPVTFDPAAECPHFELFFDRIQPNREIRRFLQRVLGYTLIGGNPEQILVLCIGIGANGKTTLVTVLRRVLGDYAVTCDATTLLAGNDNADPRPDLTRLIGARALFLSEIGAGRYFDEPLVKGLTGCDPIVQRTLYREPIEFVPQFTPFLAANQAPGIRDTSHAMWRRVLLVTFPVAIPKEEQDPHLADTLAKEAPGILAWLVRGCLEWQRDGLNPPPDVLLATEDYRNTQDPLAEFFTTRCLLSSDLTASAADLYRAYCTWAEEAGERHALSRRAFGLRLRERGLTNEHRRDGWRWRGIGLLGASQETDLPLSSTNGDRPPRDSESADKTPEHAAHAEETF